MLRIDVWNILFTVINLLILFIAIRKFLFRPIQDIIAKRQEEADSQFKEANEMQKLANAQKQQYEESMNGIEEEKKKVLADTRKTANKEYQRIVMSANQKAERVKIEAAQSAEHQKEIILKNVESEIADMVVEATNKIVAKTSDENANRALYDEFLNKAGDNE